MSALIIPLGLILLMAVVGAETRVSAFRALGETPRPLIVAVLAQIVGLPLLAVAVAGLLDLPGDHAAGLLLVAAAPAGVTSNFVTLMARGDVAASILTTVATSAAAPFAVPIVLTVAPASFGFAALPVALPFGPTFGAVAAVTVLPLALGIAFARRRPDLAERLRPLLRRVSGGVFLIVVAAAILAQSDALLPAARVAGLASLTFAVSGLVALLGLARLARLDAARTVALVLSGTLRNIALALAVAVSLLGRPDMAAVATVHVVTMNLVALLYVAAARRLSQIKDAAPFRAFDGDHGPGAPIDERPPSRR